MNPKQFNDLKTQREALGTTLAAKKKELKTLQKSPTGAAKKIAACKKAILQTEVSMLIIGATLFDARP